MLRRRLWVLPVACGVGALLVLAACGEQEGTVVSRQQGPVAAAPTATEPSPVQSEPELGGGNSASSPPDGIPPALTSLRALLEDTPIVVVGEVSEGSELVYVKRTAYDPCPTPRTIFRVRIERIIFDGGVELPAILPVQLAIGPDPEGCVQVGGRWQDSPLKFGAEYLFFLVDGVPYGWPGYVGPPEGRFELTEDGRIIPNGSESRMPAPAAVSGASPQEVEAALSSADRGAALEALARVTVDEAAEVILAAVAEGPLPTPYGGGEVEETPSPAEGPEAPAANEETPPPAPPAEGPEATSP